ncbi:hypothetical protein SAMN04488072_101441 [Lentibacillus halodurans]|uniref:ChsH2 C-terminal OB-fold domain-containing protein n=1 Tax=Lentibacillus halodurans TaxID=237679 RepID=A0A1I0VIE3_9BACI|nr:OB-fold domain-containing protein [Lentibacillus halodurans]SFA76091.1 hypothetical protein SAMN04488072_101441 [Lentibacillus halodurans]
MTITAKYCNNCNYILHADKNHCASCFSDDLETKELKGLGEVYSYTKIHAAPKDYADIAPYYIVLIDLDEGLRITGRYIGESVEINQKVKVDNVDKNAYIFKALEE